MTQLKLPGNEPPDSGPQTLASKAISLLRQRGLMRAAELRSEGVTPSTLSRMAQDGLILRVGRGLYQLADAPMGSQHDLARAAKRVPKGVICLSSALAFHGLTDQLPRRVWMAIGLKDWRPTIDRPPLRIIRMSQPLLDQDVEHHLIDGVDIKVFGAARSVIDTFRSERAVGRNLAIESLREALRQRKTTPAKLAEIAMRLGAWTKVRPYLEALTADA
ncbi:MAG TPA: type IV toxin-antitoxin system AbiEi family antitoxin domain-containing protein [Caulobacteraceae bacterium]|jgi:predicted transcriptional regulator of viral defense system|nr:type IV toxin-antitoxin system AbiEi family antitoxin domain-containing protein [Caulobacteraceae bacterium]